MCQGPGYLDIISQSYHQGPKSTGESVQGTGNWKVEKISHLTPALVLNKRSSLEDKYLLLLDSRNTFGKASILNIFRNSLLSCIISNY